MTGDTSTVFSVEVFWIREREMTPHTFSIHLRQTRCAIRFPDRQLGVVLTPTARFPRMLLLLLKSFTSFRGGGGGGDNDGCIISSSSSTTTFRITV